MTAPNATTHERLVPTPAADLVGRLARRGAAWNLALLSSRHLGGLVATGIVSRLLTPDDFGLIGMAALLTALLQAVSDLGLSWATVQRSHLSMSQVDNLFWINAVAGILLWGGCSLASPALAHFFGRPELVGIGLVMGISFFFAGLSAQPVALMTRQMRFGSLAAVEWTAWSVGTLMSVVMALRGWGYWALVGQAPASQFVRLVASFLLGGYRPGRPRWTTPIRELLGFGGYLSANGLLIYLARNTDNMIVGKVWGAEELGYYTRAYFLMTLPTLLALGPLNGIMVPALSALKDDRERMGEAYRKAIRLATFLGAPIAAGLAVTAGEVIRLVYGPAWGPVGPILVGLSITGVFQPIYNTVGWLFISGGRGGLYFSWNLVVTMILLAGFLIGVRWGGVGVAFSYAILMSFVITGPTLWMAHRAAGLSLKPTLDCVVPLIGAALVMAATVYGVGRGLKLAGLGWATVLAIKITVGVTVYGVLTSCWVKPHPLSNAILLIQGRFPAWRRLVTWSTATG